MALPSSVFIQHKPQNCHHNIKQHWTVLGNYLNKNIGKHPSSYRHSQHLYHSPQHSLLSQCHTPQTLLTCSPLSSKTFVSHRCCPSLVTGKQTQLLLQAGRLLPPAPAWGPASSPASAVTALHFTGPFKGWGQSTQQLLWEHSVFRLWDSTSLTLTWHFILPDFHWWYEQLLPWGLTSTRSILPALVHWSSAASKQTFISVTVILKPLLASFNLWTAVLAGALITE